MTERVEQLALFAGTAENSGTTLENLQHAALSRHVPAGAARLLRDLAKRGLDPKALPAAAALVLELDADARARNVAESVA